MEKYLKSIKVVSLFEQNCNCYLTACEDKKKITLIRKPEWSSSGSLPNGAEWRVKWIKGPTGNFTGKCRLHSIYKKVLMVRREGQGQGQGQGQEGYIRVYQDRWPPLDQQDTCPAVEWNLCLKQVSLEEGLGIEANLTIDYQNVRYSLAGPNYMMCSYDRFASPKLEPYNTICRSRLHNWVVHQLVEAEQLLKHKKDSKKSSSTNTNNTPLPLVSTITSSTTSSTVAASKQVAVSYNGRYDQLSQLTGWQVGQVVLNYFTPGVGGSYSHYNSGHNVNGSGNQTNGDVNVNTEIGNTRDVSVNFYTRNS